MVFCVPFCTTIAPSSDVHVPSAAAPAPVPPPSLGRSVSGAPRGAAAPSLKPALKNHDEQSVRKGVAFSKPSGYTDGPSLEAQAAPPAAVAVAAPRSFRRSLADPDVLAASAAPSRPTTGNTCRTLSGASAISRGAQRSDYGDDFDESIADDVEGREWSDAELGGYATSRTVTGTTVRSAAPASAAAAAAAAGGGKGGKKLKGHRGTWSRKVLTALHLLPSDDGRARLPSVMVYTQRRPPLAARTVGQRWWTKVKGWAVSVGGRAAGGDKLLSGNGPKGGGGGGRRIRARGGGGGADSFADDTAHNGFMASASCGDEALGVAAAAAALDTSVHGLGLGMGLFASLHNPDLDISHHHPSVSTVCVDPSHHGGRGSVCRPSFPDASVHGGRLSALRNANPSRDLSAHGGGVGGSRIVRAAPPPPPLVAPPRVIRGGGGSGGYGSAVPPSPSLDVSAHGASGGLARVAPLVPTRPYEGPLASPFSPDVGGMRVFSECEDASHHRGTVMLYDGSQHHQHVMAALAAGGGGSLHDGSRRRAAPVPAAGGGDASRRSHGGGVPRVVSARHHSLAAYSPPTVHEGGISIRSGACEPTVRGGSIYSRHSAHGPPSPPMVPALAFGMGHRAISSDGPLPESIVGGAWHGTPFGGRAALLQEEEALGGDLLERELTAAEAQEQATALTRTPTEDLRRCSVGDTLSATRLPPLRPAAPPHGSGRGGAGGGGGRPVAEDCERAHSYYLPGSTHSLALWSQL